MDQWDKEKREVQGMLDAVFQHAEKGHRWDMENQLRLITSKAQSMLKNRHTSQCEHHLRLAKRAVNVLQWQVVDREIDQARKHALAVGSDYWNQFDAKMEATIELDLNVHKALCEAEKYASFGNQKVVDQYLAFVKEQADKCGRNNNSPAVLQSRLKRIDGIMKDTHTKLCKRDFHSAKRCVKHRNNFEYRCKSALMHARYVGLETEYIQKLAELRASLYPEKNISAPAMVVGQSDTPNSTDVPFITPTTSPEN